METDMERLIMRMMKGSLFLLLFAFLPPFSCFAYCPPFPLALAFLLFLFPDLVLFFVSIPGAPLSFNVIE